MPNAATKFCGALLLVIAVALAGSLAHSSKAAGQAYAAEQKTLQQRREFRLAVRAVRAGRRAEFERRAAQLQDYVLAPYLAYFDHRVRLKALRRADIERFGREHSVLDLEERLLDAWLLELPGQNRWREYRDNFRDTRSATRRCYYLRAVYRTGDRDEALAAVPPLWLVGKSQPKACDSLFRTWIDAGLLTDELVWQRLTLALARNEVSLGRYLSRLMKTASARADANAFLGAHTHPRTRFKPAQLRADTPRNRVILAHGIRRLARSRPQEARTIWLTARVSHEFSGASVLDIEATLALEAAEDNLFPPVSDDIARGFSVTTLERIAREGVRNRNWGAVRRWTARLPERRRQDPEWRFWHEYSSERLNARAAASDAEPLAEQRHYYGFLTALQDGVDSQLHHQASPELPELQEAVAGRPGVQRALELFAVEENFHARREWREAFKTLEDDERIAAAQIAARHGWLDQSIIAANAAGLHDDLNLRFPEAFDSLYAKASHATHIPVSTLLAVTRQESAFGYRARSSADARGLMQLLPSTARHTAKLAGLRTPTTLDLYEPAINIRIASEYLARLLERYNHQRPLAFAAYNAGERRVDRWIEGQRGVPMEIWIESIPFRETRGYVKSVLAFNHLYSKRRGKPEPLLFPFEYRVM
ncbi:MAG: transglycosylase SLT domain-containing protein [Pseudomonadota bacterium]